MKSLISTLVLVLSTLVGQVRGQAPYFPDRYPDEDKGPTRYRENAGQVIDTNGDQVDGVKFYVESSPLGIYLTDKSLVHFTWASTYKDSLLADTTFRIDLSFDKGRDITPHEYGTTPDIANYYIGTLVAEDVKAYHRVRYHSVWDSIDVHFHHGSTGPRMSFIVRPGGTPEDIDLRFDGQDSLNVDWEGRLEVWLKSKWIKFEEAVAFQVGTLGNVIPVDWTASYANNEGSAHVKFDFGEYNSELPLILQIGYPPLVLPPTEEGNLEWSTYLGGNGGDELESVEVDEVGDVYACGSSWSGNFPVSPGSNEHIPFLGEPQGTCNAVIMKFRANDKRLSWATYYGGSVDDTWQPKTKAAALAVYTGTQPGLQYVYVTGSTSAQDFAVWRESGSAFQSAHMESFEGGTARMWVGGFRKFNGQRHWATTHGETGGDRTWGEHGLTIDVDPNGRIAVGGMLESYEFPYPVDFEVVTPATLPGALARSDGDGFLMHFDGNFQIRWSSTLFCDYGGTNRGKTRVTDIDFGLTGGSAPGLWFVGLNWANSCEMHFVPPPPGGFYQTDYGNMIIGVLDLATYEIDYCTAWGSGGGAPYAVHNTEESVWVVGYTSAQELTTVELPPPPGSGTGAIHTTTHAGGLGGQWSDGFLLRFKRSSYSLDYGTLVGGQRDDILLDITSDANDNVYITGETRSSSGFSFSVDEGYYEQAEYGNPNRRDAILIGISGGTYPRAFWRSIFGGTQSDRGWGIAASEEEVFLVGSTGSQYTDDFPLREFSVTSDLDYYQAVNLMGSANWFIPWVEFELAMDFEHTGFGEAAIEPTGSPHDGFIASFGIDPMAVGLHESTEDSRDPIEVFATSLSGVWRLEMPRSGNWSYRVVDASGRVVQADRTKGSTLFVDLNAHASGVYAVSIQDGVSNHATKLLRP